MRSGAPSKGLRLRDQPSAVRQQPSAVGRLLSVAVLLLALPFPARAQQIPHTVGRWEPDSTGNHRAVVRVASPADAVRVHRDWRRRDRNPEEKRVVVVAAATGERVANVARAQVTRESGDIVFQPAATFRPGEAIAVPPGKGWVLVIERRDE